MKTLYAVLISVVFAAAACGKGKKEEPKAEPETKPTEPAKADPAAGAPTPTPDPAAAAPKAEPAAGGGATMSVDEAGKMAMAFAEKLSKAVDDAGGDCAKMAGNLKPLEGEAKEMSAAGKAFDADEAKKKEFEDKYGKQMMEKFATLGPKLMKCQDNAEVKSFFSNM